MRALLAAMQLGIALRTIAIKVDPLRKGSGTVKAPGRRDMLHQAGQARTSHVQRRTRSVWLRAVFTVWTGIAVRVHVPVLSVLAVAVHWESYSVVSGM